MSGESKGVARKEPCPICGRVMGVTGLGRHMRAHEDAAAAQEGVERLERLAGHKVTSKAVAPASGHQGGADGITTLDVAMAVLAKVSPDARVPVAALPDVLAWVEHTDRVIRLVQL